MSEERERSLLMKLDALKDIRPKVINVERIRARLVAEVESIQQEELSLADYRQEMDLLLQEKMAHVEELRQIHADINAMENIIKSTEEQKSKSLEHARRLYDEYIAQKQDGSRVSLQQLDLNFPSLMPDDDPIPSNFFEKAGVDWNLDHDDLAASGSGALSLAPMGSLGGGPPSFMSSQPSLSQIRATPHKIDRPLPPPPGPPAPSFRQQPPPMKSCLSCHQQIHRNAPICPLCKAKSRSRNPKKPKKKD